MCFSKLYLHMATHGYTCVNPVLVLFYTCSFVFFQFCTCVTPFFLVYTWLHMATHGYTSTTHLRKFPRSPIVWPEVLPLSGREGAQCQAPHTDKSFKLTIQDITKTFFLSTGFLYDYILQMGMDTDQNDVHFLAPGMPFVWFSKFIVSDTVISKSRT